MEGRVDTKIVEQQIRGVEEPDHYTGSEALTCGYFEKTIIKTAFDA